MRKFVPLVLFFLLFSCGCSAQKNTAQKAALTQASRSTDPNTWDFGTVKTGEIKTHEFIFKNNSEKPLVIKEVNTSCGCTASQARSKNLLPGESTVIEVKFDGKGYSGQTQQFIYVYTDSIDNPVTRFIVKADVQK